MSKGERPAHQAFLELPKVEPYIHSSDLQSFAWTLHHALKMKDGKQPPQPYSHMYGLNPAIAAFCEWWTFSTRNMDWAAQDLIKLAAVEFKKRHEKEPTDRQLLAALLTVTLHHNSQYGNWIPVPMPRDVAIKLAQGLQYLEGGETTGFLSPASKRGSKTGNPVTKALERQNTIRSLYLLRGGGFTRTRAVELLKLTVQKREVFERWEPDLKARLSKHPAPKNIPLANEFEFYRHLWFIEGVKLSGASLDECLARATATHIGSKKALAYMWTGVTISELSRKLFREHAPLIAWSTKNKRAEPVRVGTQK